MRPRPMIGLGRSLGFARREPVTRMDDRTETALPEPDPRPDAELVGAAAAGDRAAFEVLYRRHRDWSVRLAFRFTRDGATALDAAHEAWVYVLRKLPTLRLARGNGQDGDVRFTTFLYPVVRSCAVTALRKRRVGQHAAAEPTGEPAEFEHAALRTAVDALPDGPREVLLMRVVHEMSVRDISAALGVPEGTVKSRLHAAVRALREHPGFETWFG